MPTLSTFYGITIRMYFRIAEHNPPHIHAIYGDNTASIDLNSEKIIDGYLPKKAEELVIEWLKLHKKELLDIWNNQEFKKIDPLE